jgi:release factor glutamine methyltransferase
MTEAARARFSEPVEPPAEGRPWTVLHLLRWSTQYLEGRGVPDVRLDVEHLLADTLGLGRLELYLHFERPLDPEELQRFRPRLLERAERRPLQYILGRAAFRELELAVDERVLIPRPETEELVDAVLSRVREWGREGLDAVDVGTGSGAIALSLAREGPFRRVFATDRSPRALDVARANARSTGLEARVSFHEGDLLTALPPGTRVQVVVSNPPYVAPEEIAGLAPEVAAWEPREALEAEGDGLTLLEALVRTAPAVLEPGGLLALEIGAGQGPRMLELLRAHPAWEGGVVLRDLSRRDRIVLATRRGENGAAQVSTAGTSRGDRKGQRTETKGGT